MSFQMPPARITVPDLDDDDPVAAAVLAELAATMMPMRVRELRPITRGLNATRREMLFVRLAREGRVTLGGGFVEIAWGIDIIEPAA